MKTIELTEEQVKMIVKSINQTCRDMEMYLLEINKPSFDNIPDTIDVKKYLVNQRVKYQTLLNYIEQV